MHPSHRWVRRVINGLRKVAAGLRPLGESVWPGVRNDLFVAHESIYHFAIPFASGAAVLDAGCGTGYGSRILAEAGAAHVLGIDVDRFSVIFARRHYASDNIVFEKANCEVRAMPEAAFDLILASNVLEHLEHPDRFLSKAFMALRPAGHALFAVPPITSMETAALHRDIHYHRSILTVAEWLALLASHAWSVTAFAHTFIGSGAHPDFTSPFPSDLSSADFAFTPVPADRLSTVPSITAVFIAAKTAA